MPTNIDILSLSVEILVEILSYLHYHDLLRCQQISRTFRTLVYKTPSLQYTLGLGITGYDDGRSTSGVLRRLESLRRIQRAWRDPHLALARSVVVPSQDWVRTRWSQDFVVATVPTNTRRLDIFRLGTAVPDEECLQTLSFDINFEAAYVDPGQDLVVLNHYPPGPVNRSVRPPPKLYLRSLSTQKPHPKAREPFIDLSAYGVLWVAFSQRLKMQISGDYLRVTVYKRVISIEAILVWHWPTGTINASLRSPLGTQYLDAFCSPSGYLLVNQLRHLQGNTAWFGICVYALNGTEEKPSLLARFALPTLYWDPSSLLSSTFFPSYMLNESAGGTLSTPTDCTPGCALIQLRMDNEYTLYTPLETFLSDAVRRHPHHIEPLEVAWEQWGPRAARIFQEPHYPVMVLGYRAVYADFVRDFCPYGAAVDMLLGESETAPVDPPVGELHTEPSTLRASMFRGVPVTTSLPYRETPLRLPASAGALTSDVVQLVWEDVDGPKLIRAACKDFVLVPTSVDVYSISARQTNHT